MVWPPPCWAKNGWDGDLTKLRQKLLASTGISSIITDISHCLTAAETKQRNLLSCGTKDAKPGCAVKVRYLYQVLRAQPPEQVFAQLLTGFELAGKDPRVVGINMVQAEDGFIPMRDYKLQMQMVNFFYITSIQKDSYFSACR